MYISLTGGLPSSEKKSCVLTCFVSVVYLKLEDAAREFRHPCVMDIKVGPITYDHEADEAKIGREMAKSPSLLQVGYQIVGIRVRVLFDCHTSYAFTVL